MGVPMRIPEVLSSTSPNLDATLTLATEESLRVFLRLSGESGGALARLYFTYSQEAHQKWTTAADRFYRR